MKIQKEKGSLLLAIVVVVAFVGIIAAAWFLAWQKFKEEQQNPVACTQETKVCPDGSTVSRTGSNCEFAPCPPIQSSQNASWITYKDDEYGFEIKYPNDWKVAKNIFRPEPDLIFCPSNLTDPDPGVVCKLKSGTAKSQYEEGMIYLFAINDSDPKPDNPKYHNLGSANGKYYYLFSNDNELIVNQMISTFKFTR